MNTELPPASPLPALGAHAHCQRHSPGQRANAEALVLWQSRGETRRLRSLAERQPWPRSDAVEPSRELSLDTLAWLPAGADAAAGELGSMQLWDGLPGAVEWLDLTLAIHSRGRWLRLQPELADGSDEADGRLHVELGDDELLALAALGIGMPALRRAAARADSACWVCRIDGMGAFVAGLLDLGWDGGA